MNVRIHRRPRAYFVGRRPYEAPEVYAVTGDQVRRLRPCHEGGVLSLDWHRPDARALELSHVLLTGVANVRPSRALTEHFMHDVLASLPDDGFVLDSEEVWRWLQREAKVDELALLETARQSRLARLRASLRRSHRTQRPAHGEAND